VYAKTPEKAAIPDSGKLYTLRKYGTERRTNVTLNGKLPGFGELPDEAQEALALPGAGEWE
jgi:hypothetical protein